MIKRLIALSVMSVALVATILTASSARAAVIDMEGIAPAGGLTTETNSTHSFSGFDVSIARGHYVDSAAGGQYPNNGTDILQHDNLTPLVITRTAGGAFSIQSFDATFFNTSSNNHPENSHDIDVVGSIDGGGMITTTFTIDDNASFETFLFGAGWTNLIQLSVTSPDGLMAYDNFFLFADTITAAPVPGLSLLFGCVLLGVAFGRRR